MGSHAVAFGVVPTANALQVAGVRRMAIPQNSEVGVFLSLQSAPSLQALELQEVQPSQSTSARFTFLQKGPGFSAVLGGYGSGAVAGRVDGWVRWIDQNGQCNADFRVLAGDPKFDDLKTTAAAFLNSGDLLTAGDARSAKQPQEQAVWIHHLKVATNLAADRPVSLGSLQSAMNGRPILGRTETGPNPKASFAFSVPTRQRMVATVRSIDGSSDLDFVIQASDGRLLDIASRGGQTKLVQRVVEPGSYQIHVVSAAPSRQFVLALSALPVGSILRETPPRDDKRANLDRRLLNKELQLLGFDVSRDAAIATGLRTTTAVQAFQAAFCMPETGELSAELRNRLAFTAGAMERSRAMAAIAAWKRVESAKIGRAHV